MTNKLRAFFVFVSLVSRFFLVFFSVFAFLASRRFFLLAASGLAIFGCCQPRPACCCRCVFAAAAAAVAALMALVITFNCHCKVFASHQKWQRLSADSIARLALTSCLLAAANWRHLALVSFRRARPWNPGEFPKVPQSLYKTPSSSD